MKPLKFLHISELLVNIFDLITLCFDLDFNHVLVTVDGELLIDVRSLFRGYFEFVKGCMNVSQHIEVVVGEEDIDGDRLVKLV